MAMRLSAASHVASRRTTSSHVGWLVLVRPVYFVTPYSGFDALRCSYRSRVSNRGCQRIEVPAKWVTSEVRS